MTTTAPAQPIVPTQGATPPALDPTIVNLAKAIRDTETRGQKDPYTAKGGSGEFGAYQYTPATWSADAKTYLGKDIPLAQADKLMQNEVAYKKLSALKGKGYNVGQIASIWNSGSPEWEGKTGTNKFGVKYNVPQYVDTVSKAYQALKSGQTPSYGETASTIKTPAPEATPDQESAARTGSVFGATTGEGPLAAGLKTAGNLIPSAFGFVKGAIGALNPVNTLKNLAAIPGAFNEAVAANGGSVGSTLAHTAEALPGEAYKATVPLAARDLLGGDLAGAQREVTNDPFGSIAPLVLGGRGIAGAVDSATGAAAKANMADYVKNIEENTKAGVPIPKGGTNFGGAVDSAISKTSEAVTKPLGYAFGKTAEAARGGPKLTPEDYAGEILQGDTTMRSTGAKVLGKLDTKGARGVETYDDLSQRLGSAIEENQAKVDTEYAKDNTPVRLAELTQRSKGIAPINYVSEALKGLQEFYSKSRDVQSAAWAKNMATRAKTTGLTPSDINTIAKKYGGEFGSKAFSRVTGEPLTSVNAQAYENVRSGLKTTARNLLKDDAAKTLDKQTSDMIKVKEAADKVREKVNALDQRIQQRGLLTKVGRAVGGVVDIATGGIIRGFFQKILLDSNRGNKSFNSLQIEENLAANLKKLQYLERVNDGTLVRIIKETMGKVNDIPNARPAQVSVFGRPQQKDLASPVQ